MSNDPPASMNATAEYIAYQLLLHVMQAEGRSMVGPGATTTRISRNLILDAYADCLEAVRGQRAKRSPRPAV